MCLTKIFILLWICLLFSCSGTQFECLKTSGPKTKEIREIADFYSLALHHNINLFLTKDSINKLEISGGKNILRDIKTEVSDNKLSISNENECTWLNGYNEEINIFLHYKNLRSIYYDGVGNIKSENTLKSDNFLLDVTGKGSIELSIDVKNSWLQFSSGVTDIYLKGRSENATINAWTDGTINCKELLCDSLVINSKNINDCFVNVSVYLNATIFHSGNVYYFGNPKTIISELNGKGQVIKADK